MSNDVKLWFDWMSKNHPSLFLFVLIFKGLKFWRYFLDDANSHSVIRVAYCKATEARIVLEYLNTHRLDWPYLDQCCVPLPNIRGENLNYSRRLLVNLCTNLVETTCNASCVAMNYWSVAILNQARVFNNVHVCHKHLGFLGGVIVCV